MVVEILLDPLSPGKPVVGLVPPLDLVALAKLPAQQNDAIAAKTRKIDQPACMILQFDTDFIQVSCQLTDLVKGVDVGRATLHPAAKSRCRGGRARLVAVALDPFIQVAYGYEFGNYRWE